MAITYPRNPPDPFNLSRLSLTGVSAVSRNTSPFTLQTQQLAKVSAAVLLLGLRERDLVAMGVEGTVFELELELFVVAVGDIAA